MRVKKSFLSDQIQPQAVLGTIESLIITKGISEKQIDQLIRYTANDEEISKFTHDRERFKDKEAYKKWAKEGRVIYTLTDKENNLLGIIWFTKRSIVEAPGCDFTWGIRTYPPVRGKGFAKRFIETVFKDFKSNGIWLSTLKTNLKAKELYESVGFKEVGERREEILMVLQNRES